MPSILAWLDYSDDERRRALEIISQLGDHGTVDELGIGTIRDALSERLFPGTSVLHTRARYFLFIPWLYQIVERRYRGSDRVQHHARKAELALIGALLDGEDKLGIIGRVARDRLKTLPSAMYWAGLRSWGLLNFDGPLSRFHAELARPPSRFRLDHTDDGDLIGDHADGYWHAGMPEAPSGFPEVAQLALTRTEAKYLIERITLEHSHSLLAWLARHGQPDDAALPWEYAQLTQLPARIRVDLEHARLFSETINGAALLYNLMLAEARPMPERVAEYQARLDEWCAMMVGSADDLSSWKRDEFWALISKSNANIPGRTRTFADQWLDAVVAQPGADPAASDVLRQLIRVREQLLKGGLARLSNRAPLERWNGESGTRRLDYRWRVVAGVLDDIHAALGRGED